MINEDNKTPRHQRCPVCNAALVTNADQYAMQGDLLECEDRCLDCGYYYYCGLGVMHCRIGGEEFCWGYDEGKIACMERQKVMTAATKKAKKDWNAARRLLGIRRPKKKKRA